MTKLATRYTGLLVIAALATLCGRGPAHGDVIASYGFSGGAVTSADTEANSTAGNFTLTNPAGSWGVSSTSHTAFARSLPTTVLEGAATLANYFSFTSTPSVGFELDLTSLTFTTLHNATAPDTEGAADETVTMNFFVRSSLDGFASNVGPTFSQAWNTSTSRSIDLTGISFQNITGPITFRFYVYESAEVDTKQGSRWDNVVLNGTVAEPSVIPTPAALPVGSVLLGVIAARRRRA